MTEDVMTEIENEIRNNKVVMYMKGTPASPQCGFSAATTEILQDLGKPFHTVDVLSSPEKRDAIKRFSNWPKTSHPARRRTAKLPKADRVAGVLRYPLSATAGEKPLPRKGPTR